ncbi:MAG: isoleucine--tRNA ligase [Candidatus Schekmanbacteria bacterium]|nr:isoleucine--tRNA ligase [Candidatus Schekmanbacteria bacterium]
MDYKDTLNLPQTSFPMKAGLSQNEPKLLDFWKKINLHSQILQKKAVKGKYTLHDGPPYANGNIHIGHALNKILKDFIVKSKTMSGYQSHYIPGWDCHGLPIEHQVDKNLGAKKAGIDKYQKRQLCREYAQKYIDIQREEFKRLGVLGDWEHPYLTFAYKYEADIVRQLGQIVKNGLIYRGNKPVHWCTSCATALAEAEVEYQEHQSPSIYVKFALEPSALAALGLAEETSIIIWTTTPWTLPANLAVALHPEFDYVLVKTEKGNFILAAGLLDTCMKQIGIADYQVLQTFKAKLLERTHCRHPFYDRTSLIIIAPYVTLEQGTGCVHTAPGHGQEDYVSGMRYGLQIYNPVDGIGKFAADLPLWGGLFVWQANPLIVKHLQENGTLLATQTIGHTYPHCWRCKNPLIFRATEQWFISMDETSLRATEGSEAISTRASEIASAIRLPRNDNSVRKSLRQRALAEIARVQWIPPWGQERISNMIANRPDWCISRQRSWGVPITAFYCAGCHQLLLDDRIIAHVADLMEAEGSDIWFTKESRELLPAGTVCAQCGGSEFTKEMDILDVWFDSGASFAAVLAGNPHLNSPADLYLEGSDQHRGWFHSSLLIGVANQGKAPYQSVLTHGFVVDGRGKKMSKSQGNVIAPQKIIEQNGAEILRLWVAAEDYKEDVRISPEILLRLTEAYRRIRNTCRFLLGNLADFNPVGDSLPYEQLLELDRWALHKLQDLIRNINNAYQTFEFHVIYHSLHNFCTVTLSAVYLDILKDRLYCSAKNSRLHRSAQTVLWEILHSLVRLMAPILSFTAEEVWQSMPQGMVAEPSVHLATMPEVNEKYINQELANTWEQLLGVRTIVYKSLEAARNQKLMGSFLEAGVSLYLTAEALEKLQGKETLLSEIFIVSAVVLKALNEFDANLHKVSGGEEHQTLGMIKAGVDLSTSQKCERCWNYYPSVGKDADYPTLCERCAGVIRG